jgi:hypothetical protein
MRRQDGISTEAVGRAAHAGTSVVLSQLAAACVFCRKSKRVDGTSASANATKKNAPYGRSGQGDACEEQAQGNGETPVRAMRHQARTRRGGGIPPTKHRDANGGCSAREESSFSPKRATSMRRLAPAPESALRGHGRGRSRAEPSRVRRLRQDSPPTAYMYTPSGVKDAGIGRSRKASTVAPTVTAHWKANQHSTGKASKPAASEPPLYIK